MEQHTRAPLQRADDPVDSYVVPLMTGLIKPADEHPLRVRTVEGTGFLLAGGRGLGITARHVALAVQAAAPITDSWVKWSPETEIRVPLAAFPDSDGNFRSAPIAAFDMHPTEDVALFRLPDDDYFSPYSISTDQHYGAAEYSLWGYPDEVRHDYFSETNRQLNVPLVYSAGHVRRRVSAELPINAVPGRHFYELSTPAGQCASGAPVSVRRDPWRAIGVYVGERRNETGTFSVGFATRSEVIAKHWPQLADGTADLSLLCPLPTEQLTDI